MNKKIVVWDLFGGGQNSVASAILENPDYEIYTFDVVPNEKNSFKHSNYHYYNLDLAAGMVMPNGKRHKVMGNLNIVNLFKKLNIPKPDIIVSSTLCQSFSNVLSMVGGGTCFWKKEKDGKYYDGIKLIEREIDEFERLKSGFTKNLNAEKQLFIKRLGEQAVINTVKLIKYFKPKYWYIENPQSSLMWFYIANNLKLKGTLNIASLGAYGYPIAKYAGFYSNVKLELENGRFLPKFKKEKFNGEDIYIFDKFTLDDVKKHYNPNLKNFVYATKGVAYKKEEEKKLIMMNFYTYWKQISKDEYEQINNRINSRIKSGSKGDRREIKKVSGKYYRRYYVKHGHSVREKGFSSLKKTSMTLGLVSKKIFKQAPGLTTIQISEASASSHIPAQAIKDIFKHFKFDK